MPTCCQSPPSESDQPSDPSMARAANNPPDRTFGGRVIPNGQRRFGRLCRWNHLASLTGGARAETATHFAQARCLAYLVT